MSKRKHDDEASSVADYTHTLHDLRIQLVKLQSQVIREGLRIVVVLEGRDGAGKDGAIKRIVKHLSPRETRVVALAKPSDRETSSWYFERFASQLPTGGEIVLFNRSWYNRAGVESVMGFCSPAEHESFLEDAPRFEELLVRSGLVLRKYYLDISKAEQERRLADRATNPLKQWKVSPIDEVAVKNWEAYSEARNEMFARTHTVFAPWSVVRTDDKRAARINLIKTMLASIEYKGKDDRLLEADPDVVFAYGPEHVMNRTIVR
jgi:polyphosphate kinase